MYEQNVNKRSIYDVQCKYKAIYDDMANAERSLPSVNDGMRMVQRRILWTIIKNGYAKLQKCASIIGRTMGETHPHAGESIYNSLVGMATDIHNVIDGKGNFGVNNRVIRCKAAAYRYTEAKLSDFGQWYLHYHRHSLLTVSELDYDEPAYLPVAIPYALLNGFIGLGGSEVAIIPSYKLSDLVTRCKIITGNMKDNGNIPVPYFGNKLKVTGEIKELYKTGIGKIAIHPHIKVKNNEIQLLNVCPLISLEGVFEQIDKLENGKYADCYTITDLTSDKMDVRIKFNTRQQRIKFSDFKEKLDCRLIKNMSCKIKVYCGFKSYEIIGVDQWLAHTCNKVKIALATKYSEIHNKLLDKLALYEALLLIRPLYKRYVAKDNKLNDIKEFKQKAMFILQGNEPIYNKIIAMSMKQVLHTSIDLNDIKKQIKETEHIFKYKLDDMVYEYICERSN